MFQWRILVELAFLISKKAFSFVKHIN